LSHSSDTENNVFINCPFDEEYQNLFVASVFAVVACGFNARCALEVDNGGQPRIQKLFDIIEECKFGIHDISRVQLDANGLPRFNMPLELGMFLGAKRYGGDKHERKVLLIQDTEKYRYQSFISDISAMDIKAHADDPHKLIANVHSVLKTNTRRTSIPTKKRLYISYDGFWAALPDLLEQQDLELREILFAELENLIIAWVNADTQLGG
jgi:hypothetical protein